MKKYTYTGDMICAFTHEDKDYTVFGSGPHKLPAEAHHVKSLQAQGLLVEIQEAEKTKEVNHLNKK